MSHNENRKFSQQLLKQWAGLDIQVCVIYTVCNSCACVMLGRGGGREGEGRGLAKFENLFHISLPIANASFHLSPWKPLTAIKG